MYKILILSICAMMTTSCGYINTFLSDAPVQEEIKILEDRAIKTIDKSLPPVSQPLSPKK